MRVADALRIPFTVDLLMLPLGIGNDRNSYEISCISTSSLDLGSWMSSTCACFWWPWDNLSPDPLIPWSDHFSLPYDDLRGLSDMVSLPDLEPLRFSSPLHFYLGPYNDLWFGSRLPLQILLLSISLLLSQSQSYTSFFLFLKHVNLISDSSLLVSMQLNANFFLSWPVLSPSVTFQIGLPWSPSLNNHPVKTFPFLDPIFFIAHIA